MSHAMNVSVLTKLVLLAAAAIVGITALAVTSLIETKRVYTSASFANENTVPALLALDEAQTAFAAQRVNFYQILLLPDAADVASHKSELRAARQKVEAAFKTYEPTLVDDKDRALLAADRAAVVAY
jgi:methyl-accepting chemotaxis protein